MAERMTKRNFIAWMAERNDISDAEAARAYNMVINGVCDAVQAGYRLALMGFGTFYLSTHKGHPIQFESKGMAVKDYAVFKFKASNVLNDRIRSMAGQVQIAKHKDDDELE